MTDLLTIEKKRMAPPREALRIASFAVTGGIAAVCNLGSRILFSRVMRYELAIMLAYLIGMIVAYTLARGFVFEISKTPWYTQLSRFAIVNIFGFSQVWLVSVGLVRVFFPWIGFGWHPEDVAHLVGVASPIFVSYYAHKHFSFRPIADERPIVLGDKNIETGVE
jgi:putative flippase GtrA